MSCSYCTARDSLAEKARIAALEQQNTDLIAIVKQLVDKRVDFSLQVDPSIAALHKEDYAAWLAKSTAKQTMHYIEGMLEDRRQFFHDYNLLKMYASREYYADINASLLRP
jgi:hypothetical protein